MTRDDPEAQGAARLAYALPGGTPDAAARLAALSDFDESAKRHPTSLVAYASSGRLLVIGPAANAREAAERLADRLACTVLVPPGPPGSSAATPTAHAAQDGPGIRTVNAVVSRVSGHLGAFEVTVLAGGEEIPFAPSVLTGNQPFDLVLDLGAEPRIRAEVPPPGYFAPGRDADALERALAQLPDLVGEFEKPRYFAYDTDICAHGASGIGGCTRCLDACPTGAIRSVLDRVEVDPHLCQGGGVCAAVCPTGAMTYAYPAPGDQVDALRALLRRYRDAGGHDPVLLFHDAEAGRERIAALADALPGRTIPFEVEEIGSLGMDTWLAALAFGAVRVDLLATEPTPGSVRAALEEQIGFAEGLLAGMGYPAGLVRLIGDEAALAPGPERAGAPPATFAGVDEKRTVVRLAIDHLLANAPAPQAEIALPAGAPFGEIRVDAATCTLCMACVGVCPAGALAAGGEVPRLDFVEWNCVQCGLCERACPEDAIELAPRFVYERARREARQTLNEDAPFHCVSCGKPFGTTKVIARMREKLAAHWMFQKPEAARRLEMCEDCRVRDMFKDGGGLLEP